MRIEARTLAEQRNILEEAERIAKSEAEAVMRELNVCKQKLAETEIQSETLLINVKEIEQQKLQLEESLLHLNEQLISQKDNETSSTETSHKFQHEQYQQQISSLQANISSKEHLISQLQEYVVNNILINYCCQ